MVAPDCLGGASTASVPAISIYCLGRPSLVSASAACNLAGSVHILPCGREPRPTWHRGPEHMLGARPSSCRCLLGPTSSHHRLSAAGRGCCACCVVVFPTAVTDQGGGVGLSQRCLLQIRIVLCLFPSLPAAAAGTGCEDWLLSPFFPHLPSVAERCNYFKEALEWLYSVYKTVNKN